MILVIFFPLIGFMLAALFGRYIGSKGSMLVTLLYSALAFYFR